MTVDDELTALVARLRQVGAESSDVEVKAGVGGLPKSVPETLSAFANGGGGSILLGLSEDEDFRPAAGFDALAVRDAFVDACTTKVSPPLRAPVEVVSFEGARVVRVDIDELDPVDKPCFVTARGEYNGSFIRGGDGDRRLSRYEVTQLLSNRTQPAHDRAAVAEATLADLDTQVIEDLVRSVSARYPRLRGLDRDELLLHLGVATRVDDGTRRPTLAGLLCLGRHPQRWFPQLIVSLVVLPGLTMGEPGPDGRRFLDNQTLIGPLPAMVDDATAAATRNMRRGAIVSGLYREDRYDYPIEVIRELLVNALMHRDYSPEARGAQVQIEIYPDRLEVRSPGGLFGPITPDLLGTSEQRPTSRNALLAQLLSDLPTPHGRGEMLCENRGSGLQAVVRSLRAAGMSPPEFRVGPGAVDVVVPQHSLIDDSVVEWIASLDEPGLTDHQRIALAMMRSTGTTTNAMLRTWGLDMHAASQALRDLVARGLALKSGGKRYASYRLSATARQPRPLAQAELPLVGTARKRSSDQSDRIVEAIKAGHTTARAIGAALGLDYQATLRRLRSLIADGRVERTGATNSPSQSYRSTDQGDE